MENQELKFQQKLRELGVRIVESEPDTRVPGEGTSSSSTAEIPPAEVDPAAASPDSEESTVARRQRSDAGGQHQAPAQTSDASTQLAPTGDWTRFSIGHSLQELRSTSEPIIRRGLRKLHLRWFHAGASRMRAILTAAGVPAEALNLIAEIVDSCRICRQWARPSARTITSTSVVESFNKEVQGDILFYKSHIILHLVDSCIKWSSAGIMPSRSTADLLSTIGRIWISLFGPMQTLVFDHESGIDTETAGTLLSRSGIRLTLKAPRQHAQIVERHHEVLRQVLHRIESQLSSEGLDYPFELILADALFAKNAILSSSGGVSAYQALLGRTPSILPAPEVISLDGHGEDGEPESSSASKLRGIALQQIVEANAIAKLNRASKAHARITGEQLELKVGDLIEFYRPPGTKDVSGWRGPARVCDVGDISSGNISANFQGRVYSIKIGDLRRALVHFVFYAPKEPSVTQPWVFLVEFTEQLNGCIRLGWTRSTDNPSRWIPLSANNKHPKALNAFLHVGRYVLHLPNCVGGRIGHNVRKLESVAFDSAVLLLWEIGKFSAHSFLEGTATERISFDDLCGSNWPNYCFIQFFLVSSAEYDDRRDPDMPPQGDPLFEERAPLLDSRLLKRKADDPDTTDRPHKSIAVDENAPLTEDERAALDSTRAEDIPVPNSPVISSISSGDSDFSLVIIPPDPPICAEDCGPDSSIYLVGGFSRSNFSEIDSESPLELGFIKLQPKLQASLPKLNRNLLEDECYVMNGSEPVIVREYNNLTLNEARKHHVACKEAMITELSRWNEMKAWKRMLRRNAYNILDSRWVLKWKLKNGVKLIQARLTARGYKDRQSVNMETFSATTSRWGQKLLLVVVMQMGWTLVSMDVSQAFLRGVTFQDLSEETGKDLRSVQLDLPPGSAVLIRTLKGFEDFNPALECLDLIKPGYGLKDAPRLWNLALTKALNEFGLFPLQSDPQLFVKHDPHGTLLLMISTHVDDLKGGGVKGEMDSLIALLETRFDSLKIQYKEFEHLGLDHKQLEACIEIHQNNYISQLRTMNPSEFPADDEEDLPDEHVPNFMSLLGGVGWVVQTRPDVITYVGALQRHLKKPKTKHARALNRVVNYLKTHPLTIRFHKVQGPTKLAIVSDSAYKAADPDCLAIKSGIIMLMHDGPNSNCKVAPIEWLSKKQQHVCRSTYAAELHSSLDLVGMGMIVSSAFNEIMFGRQPALVLARWQDEGKFAIPMELYIDARSVFDGVTSDPVKTPADKALLLHAKALNSMLTSRQIKALTWIDTRDMIADALNKGTIDRDAIRRLFSLGEWKLQFPTKQFIAAVKPSSASASTTEKS